MRVGSLAKTMFPICLTPMPKQERQGARVFYHFGAGAVVSVTKAIIPLCNWGEVHFGRKHLGETLIKREFEHHAIKLVHLTFQLVITQVCKDAVGNLFGGCVPSPQGTMLPDSNR